MSHRTAPRFPGNSVTGITERSQEQAIIQEFARRTRRSVLIWCALFLQLFLVGSLLVTTMGPKSDWLPAFVISTKLLMLLNYFNLRCPNCDESQYKRRSDYCRGCGERLKR